MTLSREAVRLLGLAGFFGAFLLAGTNGSGQELDRSHLAAAVETAAWIRAQTVTGSQGARIPDRVGDPATTASIGTGAAGRALFFLEVAHATGDPEWLEVAMSEADAAASLVAAAPSGADALSRVASSTAGTNPAPSRRRAVAGRGSPPPAAGLYSGAAGVAYALGEVYRATGREPFRDQSRTIFAGVAQGARRDDAGVFWNTSNDVLTGTAGIGLALLYAHALWSEAESLELAIEAGDALLARGEPVGDGLRWLRGADMSFDLPNFSHGTAGIGYFLAALYAETGETRFLDAARRAARYLVELADRRDGLFLVPYGVPNDGYVTPYDIGWAHGPAGTARFFFLLSTLTGGEEHTAVVRASAATLIASGMPGPSADESRWTGPFKIDRRFGTSGAAVFLLQLNSVAPDARYPELAGRLVENIRRQSETSREGRFWTLPLYGFQGEDGVSAAFTGFFYGAAGLGMTFLEMHYASNGERALIRFPDDPFSSGR